jgi:hypothetical protein
MLNQLCAPAKFYLVMSIVYYILILLQNIGSRDRFYLGSYSCSHSNPGIILLINGLYILLWTWLLNLICSVNKTISWIIVFFPVILLFISFGIILMRGIKLESMNNLQNFKI